MSTQLDTKDLEIQRLQAIVKDLREDRVKNAGPVPIIVQDFRLEAAALHQKALLSLDSMEDLLREFHVNNDLDGDWHVTVARHLVAGLLSLRARVDGVLAELGDTAGETAGVPDVMVLMGEEEILRCAREYNELIGEHRHEAKLREWEREMSRPQGKGRPRAKPIKDGAKS